jgi:Leucine Rich repeat
MLSFDEKQALLCFFATSSSSDDGDIDALLAQHGIDGTHAVFSSRLFALDGAPEFAPAVAAGACKLRALEALAKLVLSPDSHIERVELNSDNSAGELGPDGLGVVCRMLRAVKNSKLRRLCELEIAQPDTLGDRRCWSLLLGSLDSIRVLDVSMNRLDVEQIDELLAWMSDSERCSVSDLSMNSVRVCRGTALRSMARMIDANRRLVALSLEDSLGGGDDDDDNESVLDFDAFAEFAGAIGRSRSLGTLDLDGNARLGDRAVTMLADALARARNRTLRTLALSWSSMRSGGVTALANALRDGVALHSLRLLGVARLDDEGGAISLAAALRVNTTLRMLDVSDTLVSERGVASLVSARSVSLTRLWAESCRVGDSEHIAQALANNHVLLGLWVDEPQSRVRTLLARNQRSARNRQAKLSVLCYLRIGDAQRDRLPAIVRDNLRQDAQPYLMYSDDSAIRSYVAM